VTGDEREDAGGFNRSKATSSSETERLLKEAERKLAETQRIANLGIWDFNIDTNELRWSKQVYDIFGLDAELDALPFEVFLECVHPDDKDAFEEGLYHALSYDQTCDLTHRIVLNDGTVKFVRARAEICRNEDGKAVGMSGTIQDVTELKTTERALRASEHRLTTIIDIAPEAVVAVDKDGNVQIFNRSAEEVFGYKAEEINGQPLDVLIPSELRTAHRQHIDDFAKSGTVRRPMSVRNEVTAVRKDGSQFPAQAAVSQVAFENEPLFIAILRDVTDALRVKEELRYALEEVTRANKAKSQFLALMSHELRTPLNAILGFAEMLKTEAFGPIGQEKYIEYATDIVNSGEMLLGLVDDLLDLSAAEHGNRAIEREAIDLGDVIKSSLTLVRDKAVKKGVALDYSVTGEDQPVYADKQMIKQIALNILTNAIKFTQSGGYVSIECNVTDREAVLQVSDTGIGIPKAVMSSLTEPFMQLVSNPHIADKGWGLGLAIARSLVDLHAGTLEIDSVEGKGTTVTVTIPSVAICSDIGKTETDI
jgi:PAS domain S-box-containing protein